MTTTDKEYQVKGVFNKMKQAVHYYSAMESKVLQATNTEAWGAPSSLMRSLAEGTMETEKLDIIMPALYRRLLVKDTRQWLQVYKGLVLLEYLIKYGDDRVLAFVQSHPDVLVTLQSFEFIDEKGQDKGYNVRVRSKTVNELVKDPEEIKRIRENGRLSQDRFIGVSSDDFVTNPTMEMNEETQDANMSTKELPPIQPPSTTTTAAVTTPTPTNITATVPPPSSSPSEPQQQDDMDDAIFREDFIDPLDEDNHAMVFPAAGGKGKKGKLYMDDISSVDDDMTDNQDDKKKKKIEKKEQQQKKKSRFSLSGVFSRSKQAPKTDTTATSSEQQQDNATPASVENEIKDKPTTNADPSFNIIPMDTVHNNDDDGWGDFASPDQGTEILEQVNVTEEKDDLLDLDCDMMTTSSARTSVDNNDLLLLDMDMPSFNNNNAYSQYSAHNAVMPTFNNNAYSQYSAHTTTVPSFNSNAYNGYSAHTTAMPPMMNNILPSTNSPPAMMMNNYTPNTPTTPFDFDPLGYAGLKSPTTAPPAPAPQQLTQNWYPWMATSNPTYQQKQQQQRPMTIDDLLS